MGAATAPLNDLNLVRTKIPELLLNIIIEMCFLLSVFARPWAVKNNSCFRGLAPVLYS